MAATSSFRHATAVECLNRQRRHNFSTTGSEEFSLQLFARDCSSALSHGTEFCGFRDSLDSNSRDSAPERRRKFSLTRDYAAACSNVGDWQKRALLPLSFSSRSRRGILLEGNYGGWEGLRLKRKSSTRIDASQLGRSTEGEATGKTKYNVVAEGRDAAAVTSDLDSIRLPDSLPLSKWDGDRGSSVSDRPIDENEPSTSMPVGGGEDELAFVSSRREDAESSTAEVQPGRSSTENGLTIGSTNGSTNGSVRGKLQTDAMDLAETERLVEDSGGGEPGRGWSFLSKWLPNIHLNPRARGLLLFNLLSVLWGSNIAVLKDASDAIEPAAFLSLRFSIAALVFSPFLYTGWTSQPIRKAGLELGLIGGAAYVTLSIGLLTSDAGRASFIQIFSVLTVPLLASFYGSKIPKITWFSAGMAVLGVYLLESSGPGSLAGDFWTFTAAVLFGLLMFRQEHYSNLLTKDDNFKRNEALAVVGLQLAVYAGFSAACIGVEHIAAGDPGIVGEILAGDWTTVEHTIENIPWFATIYTGLISTALCLWIEITAMKDISATEAAMVYSLEPMWGAAFAWAILGERWGTRGWIGAVCIVSGSIAMQAFGKKPEPSLTVDLPTSAQLPEGSGATGSKSSTESNNGASQPMAPVKVSKKED